MGGDPKHSLTGMILQVAEMGWFGMEHDDHSWGYFFDFDQLFSMMFFEKNTGVALCFSGEMGANGNTALH